ncbi:universal stress protein [Halorarum salinum]|uniref:Universal stress protein n=1 Tax=Halorarum salinum TaxID=2743089 RepID=A0A7D5Q998_9EURY|nr:universal stress protein [Halobaculum salinum]QLG60579.1 universal stress protein [Halobaculum salinum]
MTLSPFTALGGGDGLPEGAPYFGGELEGRRLMAPLLDVDAPALADQLGVAATLARIADASVGVLDPGWASERTLREARDRVADDDAARLLSRSLDGSTGRAGGRAAHGSRLVDEVLRAVDGDDVDTLVLPGGSPSDLLGREVAERIAVQADCDVVVANGEHGYGEAPSILVSIAGGPHSGLAADVARRVAEDWGAWIDVLHVVDGDASADERELAEEYVDAASRRIGRPGTTTTWVLEADDAAEAIVEQSRYYGLTVLGAPTTGRLRQLLSGSTSRSIRENARSVVLSARNNTGPYSLGGVE